MSNFAVIKGLQTTDRLRDIQNFLSYSEPVTIYNYNLYTDKEIKKQKKNSK